MTNHTITINLGAFKVYLPTESVNKYLHFALPFCAQCAVCTHWLGKLLMKQDRKVFWCRIEREVSIISHYIQWFYCFAIHGMRFSNFFLLVSIKFRNFIMFCNIWFKNSNMFCNTIFMNFIMFCNTRNFNILCNEQKFYHWYWNYH